MILVPEATQEQAFQLAEKLRQKIANNTFPSVEHITASFGVVEVSDETATDIVKRVDKALYEAKQLGRNQVFAAK